MEKVLVRALTTLGCSAKHIRLYQAAMIGGTGGLPELAKAARLQRSTAYLLANELVEKGLLLEDHKTYRKQYIAAQPEEVLRMLEAHYRQLGRQNIAFREALPDLRAAHQTTQLRPRVRTYSGTSGVAAIRRDMLQLTQEVLLWTNQATERHVFDDATHQLFVDERVRKRIPIRVLAVQNPEGRALLGGDLDNLRTTRLLPPDFQFTNEIYIYGDKVAVLDVGENIFGVITENEQIATSQRAIFEFVWHGLNVPN